MAAWSLGDLGDPRAVEPLITALRTEKEESVRWTAAAALGDFRDLRAVQPLIVALRTDANETVRSNAFVVLGRLTGQRFGEDAAAWQEWWDANKKRLLGTATPSP